MDIWTVFNNVDGEYVGAFRSLDRAEKERIEFLYDNEYNEAEIVITRVELSDY